MQAAKIYELQGKTAEAAAKYKELIAKFPKSIYAAEAKTKVKE
jgi:outer membrane protein assembly factor BamD (BamD/ComL family)